MSVSALAIYLRLSRDDDRAEESASIESQRAFLTQYARDRGWQIAKEYVDDGYSGLNFDRPRFQELIQDIEQGRIDTVLTKDLSRLGRDQINTAYYYQIYFPQKKVRYIAVSEGLDTESQESTSALFPFLTAANDFYAADVSRKVRTALTARKREGKFIGSQPPLGYIKDPERPGHLVVDEDAAPIVRRIYQLYLKTGSVIGVAKRLTEEKVPTPSQYRGAGPVQHRFPGVWNGDVVRRILTNPTYTGHMTQNRRKKINYKLKRFQTIPPKDWIIISNTHQPIIGQEQFDRVQELLELHSYHSRKRRSGHLLTGLAFCADCGAPMTYVKESAARTYMVCREYRRGGRLRLCTSHCIREDKVIDTIRAELQTLARQLDTGQLESECGESDRTAERQRRMGQIRRKLEQQEGVMGRLYEDRAAEELSEEEFRQLLRQARRRRAELESQLLALEEELKQREEQKEVREEIRRLLSFEELDREIVSALIERVVIHEDKTIDIKFKFQKPY